MVQEFFRVWAQLGKGVGNFVKSSLCGNQKLMLFLQTSCLIVSEKIWKSPQLQSLLLSGLTLYGLDYPCMDIYYSIFLSWKSKSFMFLSIFHIESFRNQVHMHVHVYISVCPNLGVGLSVQANDAEPHITCWKASNIYLRTIQPVAIHTGTETE